LEPKCVQNFHYKLPTDENCLFSEPLKVRQTRDINPRRMHTFKAYACNVDLIARHFALNKCLTFMVEVLKCGFQRFSWFLVGFRRFRYCFKRLKISKFVQICAFQASLRLRKQIVDLVVCPSVVNSWNNLQSWHAVNTWKWLKSLFNLFS